LSIALFIDAVGLEVFLMLLEIQLVAMLGGLLNSKVKPRNLSWARKRHASSQLYCFLQSLH